MGVGLEGCLDMLMFRACCLFICTLKKHTHTRTHTWVSQSVGRSDVLSVGRSVGRSVGQVSQVVSQSVDKPTHQHHWRTLFKKGVLGFLFGGGGP